MGFAQCMNAAMLQEPKTLTNVQISQKMKIKTPGDWRQLWLASQSLSFLLSSFITNNQ